MLEHHHFEIGKIILKVENVADIRRPPRINTLVFIANNDYLMESFNIGRRQRLNAGELCLYMTKQMSRLGLVRLAFRALFGRLRDDKDFLAMRAQAVTIQTRTKRLRVAMDGEVEVIATPLEYKIRPGALSVIVPAAKRNED